MLKDGGIVAGGNLIPILVLLSFHEYKTYTLRSLRIYYKYSELRLFTKWHKHIYKKSSDSTLATSRANNFYYYIL